eukprot:g6294.t1
MSNKKDFVILQEESFRRSSSPDALNLSSTKATHDSIAVNEWYHTAFLLLADIIGTGVLSLLGAFSKLGWLGGLFLLPLCYAANLFTGLLLSWTRTWYPNVTTYGELAGELYGKCGKILCFSLLYGYIFLVLSDYMIVLARSVQGLLHNFAICRPTAGIIAGCLLLFPNQMRSLHSVSFASIISALTIWIVLCLCVVELLSDGYDIDMDGKEGMSNASAIPGANKVGKRHWFDPELDFWTFSSALSSFVFAMAGQKIYLEMMAEMRDPDDFPKALYAATPVMFMTYAIVCVLGYSLRGDASPLYLMDVIPFGFGKTVANLLMLIHMMISYTLNQQVLCRRAHRWYDAELVDVMDETHPKYKSARRQWFFISLSI